MLSYRLSSASVPILLRKQTLGLVLPLCAGEATPRFATFFRDRLVVGARERVSTKTPRSSCAPRHSHMLLGTEGTQGWKLAGENLSHSMHIVRL